MHYVNIKSKIWLKYEKCLMIFYAINGWYKRYLIWFGKRINNRIFYLKIRELNIYWLLNHLFHQIARKWIKLKSLWSVAKRNLELILFLMLRILVILYHIQMKSIVLLNLCEIWLVYFDSLQKYLVLCC